jgi:hypothetical protein
MVRVASPSKTSAPIEVWIAMDESGEYEVGCDDSSAIDRLKEQTGSELLRLVRLKITMSPPSVEELDVAVPDEAGQTIKVKTD